ncbi:uncharacterized protein LTHEOB_6400 [Lasiodiplodia theobromae]|uniref:uncharacterized protein n=1 Tax=Lasiodiplodia theobromae TaxID=45133 RepID=UPI0015C34622|nr:uncharacterized protein LTHEOB_6400 [Lasiodiplodia theobromae]KAF4544282.1 hypothetical protein LTHEOB_6400 [Lasiodiplodia theobromae]
MVSLRSGSTTDDVQPYIKRRSTAGTPKKDDNDDACSVSSESSSESTIVVDTSFRGRAQPPLATFNRKKDAKSATPDVEIASQSEGSTIVVDTGICSPSPQAPPMASFTITARPKPSAAGTKTARPKPSAAGTKTAKNVASTAPSGSRNTTANEATSAFNAPTTTAAAAALPTSATNEMEIDDAMDVAADNTTAATVNQGDNNTNTPVAPAMVYNTNNTPAAPPPMVYNTNYHHAGALNPNPSNTREFWIWEVLYAAHHRLPEVLDLDDRPDPTTTDVPMTYLDPVLPAFISSEDDDEDRLSPIYLATTTPAGPTTASTTTNDHQTTPPTGGPPDGIRQFFVDVQYDPLSTHPWGAVLCVGRLPAGGQLMGATIDVQHLVDVRRLGWLQAIGDTDASACLWLWRRIVDWTEENARG